jgi:hypothetical protein
MGHVAVYAKITWVTSAATGPGRWRTMADANGETQAPHGLTSNALLVAVASALIAAVVSFFVAHWQSQDAARQAVAAQQVQEVIQLETAAETFDQTAYSAYANGWQCAHRIASACKQVEVNALGGPLDGSPLNSAQDALLADMNNISDSAARTDAANLVDQVQEALGEDGSKEGTAAWADASRAYAHLLIRSGQLIKGE